MKVNFLSYFLILVCTLLSVNIYRLRKSNSDVAVQFAKAEEVLVVLNEKKDRCKNDLISRESAFKELTEALNQRQKENEEVKKSLDACNKEMTEKKAELKILEEKKERAEAEVEILLKAARED